MDEWKEFTTKVIQAVINIEPTTERQKFMKLVILMYIYKSLESEEIFNYNCELLNGRGR